MARAIAGTPAAGGFALGGGAAMITHGLVHRATDDLDYFSTDADDVLYALEAVEASLVSAGFGIERMRAEPGFARLRASEGAEQCLIDLVAEPHLRPAEPSPLGPVLSLDDVAAGKVLALFGRAEPRDFVDVHALMAVFTAERLCELAAERDLGFDRRVLAEMITRIDRLDRDEFDADDETFVALTAFFAAWQQQLVGN
ncbi:MAG: nucleotidyl transferase AbiEii/AbiGii toxin family protein [Actinobacteria bacterium]|nr:nucleotidyl transferase AbiEii/AbiGii toxin family protein [Actinomycetota bacterium]